VIAYRRGAAPEIVDEGVTGFLCDDMGELVQRLHVVGRLDRCVCRADAEKRFGMERMVADHLALFERIVGTTMAA
jgi:glycosyltransferase involved in cell wall biosynthesis